MSYGNSRSPASCSNQGPYVLIRLLGRASDGWLARSVLLALAGYLSACSVDPRSPNDSPLPLRAARQSANRLPQLQAIRSTTDPAIVPFIDAHVHLNDVGMQRDMMRACGTERAVVFWGRNSSNESIAEAARTHPDLFIAFASISPERTAYRKSWDVADAQLLDRLDAMLASGRFKGIGEISSVHFPSPGFGETDYDPMGTMTQGILALARKYRVPVLLHVEWTRLREFSRLLEAFPDVVVIWAHGGYTPLFIARRMLERHPNLTYELSARSWPQHPRSPDYTILRNGQNLWPEWLALIEEKSDRFIVGTDASHRARASEIMKCQSVQKLLAPLSPAAQERVARTNLYRLLQMQP